MGLFGQKTRTATLQARTQCKVWALDYEVFDNLLNQHSSIARGLLSYASSYLARERSLSAKLMAKDVEKGLRVAFFHTSPYRNALYQQKNQYNYAMHFFTPRLTLDTVSLAAGFRVIVVSANDCLDGAVIDELHALGVEMIALRCAGFNNVDLAACQRHGISVARVPAYSPYAVAEHAIALMMALNRRTHRAHNRIREGNFSLDGLVGFDMHNRTAGVIGTGKIGTCLLNILHGFGCQLIAYDLHPNRELVERFGVRYVELDEIFEQSDIISLHAPLTPESHHLINSTTIEKMKPGVMLINTARGGLVDTEALLDGLKSGAIGYAGLDVYEEEADYFYKDLSDEIISDDMLARLTTFNNVMITSHQGSLTDIAQGNMADTTLFNIREFEQGKRGQELTNAVLARN
jgi:D-lactate dehydrogenase